MNKTRNYKKYYDWSTDRSIGETDGCALDKWKGKSDSKSFAVHPSGFLVFISPDDIELSDEYAGGDPYSVEEKMDSAFQQRRLQGTLQSIGQIYNNDLPWRLLDVGCGEGHITSKIANTYPNFDVSGFDYSVSAIDRATRLYGKDVDFCVASADCIPYQAEYFDIVVCNNIWEHIPHLFLMLEGLNRSLVAGGYLIISTPSRYRLANLLRIVRGRQVEFMSKLHVTEYTVGQVKEQLAWFGLQCVSVHSYPINKSNISSKGLILNKVIQPLVKFYLLLMRSHHIIESTVFYIAKKPLSGENKQ